MVCMVRTIVWQYLPWYIPSYIYHDMYYGILYGIYHLDTTSYIQWHMLWYTCATQWYGIWHGISYYIPLSSCMPYTMVYIAHVVYHWRYGVYPKKWYIPWVNLPDVSAASESRVLCFLLRRAESDAGHHAATAPVSAPHGPGLAAYS
jgi:hypothetical protein